MHALTIERAILVFQKSQAWFGPSAIILQPIDRILLDHTLSTEQSVIDGRVRIEALRRMRLTSVLVNAWQVTEADRLVCAELVLRGHYERAFGYLPECWSHSARDVQAFTGLPLNEALQCFATRKRVRPKPPQERKRDYERMIQKLRSMFEAFDEGELSLELDDIRNTINDSPTTEHQTNNSNSRATKRRADSED